LLLDCAGAIYHDTFLAVCSSQLGRLQVKGWADALSALLSTIYSRCATKRYGVLQFDSFTARTLIMMLAKRYDPWSPSIFVFTPDMGSDLDIVFTVFRTAFLWQRQSGPPFPVRKPSVWSGFAYTLPVGRSNQVIHKSSHSVLLFGKRLNTTVLYLDRCKKSRCSGKILESY